MKVTTKGQVTIPARIREYLEIAPHSEVDFQIRDGAVLLVKGEESTQPGSRFASMRGVLKDAPSTRDWMRATREP